MQSLIFGEKETGSIKVGKMADFIILDKDLMVAPTVEVLSTKVVGIYSEEKKFINPR